MFGMIHCSDITCHKIALILSTLTMIGSITKIFMPCNNWITKIAFFTASKTDTYSASELDRVMLLCAFNCQDTVASNTYKIIPHTSLHVTGSHA